MSLLSSDPTEDLGRMNSERQIRNKPRWLEDVVKTAESDRDEIVGGIEKGKAEIDEKNDTFLDNLEAAFDGEGGDRDDTTSEVVDRKRQVNDLLANADALLNLYQTANAGVTAAFSIKDNSLESLRRSHGQDAQRLRDVMLVGKCIGAGELQAVEQQARARELMGGKEKEVLEQASGIFGAPSTTDAAVERTLKCMERGVRRMVRGMDGMEGE